MQPGTWKSPPMPQVSSSTTREITLLLQRLTSGDAEAANQLLHLVYDELKGIAVAKMAREPAGLTLQPTALVHEAWLRLGGDQPATWSSRAHFFAAAAEAMRRILIENARRRRACRHGGELEKLSADAIAFELAAPELDDEGLIFLDEALNRLVTHDARKAEVVKHCYFVGLTFDEAAEAMGVSSRTAKRDWAYARVWLFDQMKAMGWRESSKAN